MFIDAISNVRLVQGTIRLDTMKIAATNDDGTILSKRMVNW